MAFSISALMKGAGAVAAHPITKGSALAALITGGLFAATAAGVAIPGWAFSVGPIVGTIAYKLLPTKDQQEIDSVAEKVTDVFNDIPTTYAEYPGDPKPTTTVVTNLTTSDGAPVNGGSGE